MREALLSDFLEQVYTIEQELENLADMSYDIGEAYNANQFSDQQNLSADMENLALAMTHGMASQLGFMREQMNMLSNYIRFREVYHQFLDAELEEIIDGEISMNTKIELYTRLGGTQTMNKILASLQSDWNQTFSNVAYTKIKSKVGL